MAKAPDHPDPPRRLLQVMAALRGRQGCPWDRQQTHRSLLPFLMEEAYELVEAIETGTEADLREELGDVLLQVVFHARIAEERGAFSFDEVAAGVADKLVRRHPHVFGEGGRLKTAEQVRAAWHAEKMATRTSALDGVPTGQPALLWAAQVGARAARAGFEWEGLPDIFAKIGEELEEIRGALQNPGEQPDDEQRQREALEEEVGDLLFAAVQLARWVKIDPEAALRGATRKFTARFQAMERALKEKGGPAADQGPAQWWALWERAKQETAES